MTKGNVVQYQRPKSKLTEYERGKRDENIIVVSEYDPIIFFTVTILVLFGVIMIFSSSYYTASTSKATQYNMFFFFAKQGVAVAIGFIIMISAAMFNYTKFLRKPAPYLYIAANLLLVYVRLFEEPVNGAYRWIRVPIFGSFQPSELAKVAIIIFLAAFISSDKSRARNISGLIRCGLILLLPIVLVYWGKNLSTAIIIAAIGFGIIFIASPYILPFIGAAGLGVAGLLLYLNLGNDYRSGRFAVWLNPFSDPTDRGYQTIQSLYAVASGGLFGLGFGQSNQKLKFMPEPHNDFIFAVICEELGFFGAAIILTLFGILIWRGIKVAINAPDLFGTLIATGTVVMLGAQVIINVAVVTNSIPNTGIPLPFISYGGTSIVFIMALMGILLNISRYSKKHIS